MKISGGNLEEREVELFDLTDYLYEDYENVHFDQNSLDCIKFIEDTYKNAEKDAKNVEINPMEIEGSKVLLNKHLLNHRCSCNLETLRGISKYGILASEWFGAYESAGEGRFCAFLSRLKNHDMIGKGDLVEDDNSRLNINDGNILLFFDEHNPVMQNLLHLDYFEYEYNKKNNNISMYTEQEINMFESLIEPLSQGGIDFRNGNIYDKTNYWSAIPGGIPSELVNGVCIKNVNYTDEQLDEISNLFPNAVVFNSTADILRYANTNNKTR